nr:hypothetical protein [Pseudomonas sp. BIGb0427]
MPYYLMIVADPQDIPFRFQYELAVSYAVGRIHFDHLQGYHNYARSVVAAQAAEVASTRRALFFGPCNEADAATRLSCALLVEPLAQQLATLSLEHWQVEQCVADQATKARLLGQLSGAAAVSAVHRQPWHGLSLRRSATTAPSGRVAVPGLARAAAAPGGDPR